MNSYGSAMELELELGLNVKQQKINAFIPCLNE